MNWMNFVKKCVSTVVELDKKLDEKCCSLERKLTGGATFDEKASDTAQKLVSVAEGVVVPSIKKTAQRASEVASSTYSKVRVKIVEKTNSCVLIKKIMSAAATILAIPVSLYTKGLQCCGELVFKDVPAVLRKLVSKKTINKGN